MEHRPQPPEGAEAIDSCVYGLNLENSSADEPQLPAPRSLRTTGPMGKYNMAPGRVLNLTIDSGASFHIVNNPDFLINKRPSNETISGVDRRERRCTHIGDLPIAAQDEAGAAHRLTIHNVRCVPSISDSLLSILKLWDDEKFDCLFRDVCAIRTSGGLSFPFQREHGGAGLGIWSVQVQSDQPKPPKLTSERRDASPFVGKHASTARSDAVPNREKLALSFRNEIHSSKAVSMLAALDANQLAQLMHRRLHIGAHLIRALPTLTADAPKQLSRASLSACPHWVAANACRLPHQGERYKQTSPGRLIRADIAGPFPPSVPHRYRYLLVLGDDSSRFKFGFAIGAEVRRPRRHHALRGEMELLCRREFTNLSPQPPSLGRGGRVPRGRLSRLARQREYRQVLRPSGVSPVERSGGAGYTDHLLTCEG